MALSTPQKDFAVTGGGSDEYYFRAHPRYDAVRVEFDSANTDDTSTDVTINIDKNDELDEVEADGFGSMGATVLTDTGTDYSGGGSIGTDAVARTVAVQISPGTNSAEGTIYLHTADDPAENGTAFANR